MAGFFDGSVVTHGTSIAVPHVVGTASLLWEKDPGKSVEFIRRLIDSSAKEIEGTEEYGLLDTGYALDMYDIFAENFEEKQDIQEQEEAIPANIKEPENYEAITDSEAYVEGRWNAEGHIETIDESVKGFSAKDIDLIKRGCIFPDNKELAWGGSKGKNGGEEASPQWHGRYYDEKSRLINYVAVFEMVTDTAMEGGIVKSGKTAGSYRGMDEELFKILKRQINSLDYDAVFKLCTEKTGRKYGNTKTNRKYFMYGCGIHTMTDIFAHSAFKKDGSRIVHDNSGEGEYHCDNITHYRERHEMAKFLGKYALEQLSQGHSSNGKQLIRAIKSYTKNTRVRYANIKKNVNANGYDDSILDKVNIDKSK